MSRRLILLPLLFAAGGVYAQTPNCAGVPRALPPAQDAATPVSAEFASPYSDLGAPTGVLSRAYDQALSVDQVLLRMKIENCRSVATATPAPSPVNPSDPAAYKPQTQWDNTPWRFDMTQNGKRMTADEFDAWLRAKGVRVVGRKPEGSTAAPATTTSGTQPQAQSPQTPPTPPKP